MNTPQPSNVLPYERSPEQLPVASFACAGEACMAAGKLEAEGVDCQVVEHAILHGITVRGATIAVEAEQFQRAVEVLSQTPARRCLLVTAVTITDGGNAPAPGRVCVGPVRRIFKWWGKVSKKGELKPPPATPR